LVMRGRRRSPVRPVADTQGAAVPLALFLVGPMAVGVAGAAIGTLWSFERHARFGSGSWDHGCYLHNAWLFAHGEAFSMTARSSVLGDVAFWGGTNHFMPSLVLTAPLAWLMEALGTTSLLLVAQAFVVSAAVIPLALLAHQANLGPRTTTALSAAYLFAVPTQAFLLFDVHEIAPVPLLLFAAVAVIRSGTPSPRAVGAVVALLIVLAGCKESALLYAAAVGAWMVIFVPSWRGVGGGVLVAMVALFVGVTGYLQPALLEPGGRMIHVARFVDLADDGQRAGLLSVLTSIIMHPGRALAALVTPDVKLVTIGTSMGAFGGLTLLSGEALVLALPNLAERFLSDKREMWGLGFHYGLTGVAIVAIGAIDTLRRLRTRVDQPTAFDVGAATFLVASLVGSLVASPVTPELATWTKPYYADDEAVDRYRRALALVNADDAVVAQNHFLPHVALRAAVWLPEVRFIDRADVVVLDPRASPWPHGRSHVEQLVHDLLRDERFVVAFHEASTWVFRRR
jgi:uncharacterized membrane protein